MKNVIKMSLVAAVVAGMSSVSAQAADGINLLSNVKVKGEIRPRYEMVDTDNTVNNANALTNRLVLGVGADIAGLDWLSGYVEMTDVHAVNPDNYNGLDGRHSNNVNVVADPEQTRLTQSYLDFKYNKTKLRVGRQLINLDNQRFVGAVGWRQMPQTYNAISIFDNSIENLNIAAVYVTEVNTIFADGGPKVNSYDTETLLVNAKYKVMNALTVTAYGYLIEDFGDTYGLALTGKPKLGDGLTLNYRAEYATMSDPSFEKDNSNVKTDSDYYNLILGVNMSGILAQVGYNVQSADDGNTLAGAGTTNKAFSTPLGTNHGHNGWADLFLTTPENGLEDLNLMVGYKSKQVGVLKAVYHDFQAEEGSVSYGQEIDLLYKRAIPGVKNLTGMLKYADYSADDSAASGNPKATDVQKFWVMLDYKFSN